MPSFREIYNGWKNAVLQNTDKVPAELKQISEERLQICQSCPQLKEQSYIAQYIESWVLPVGQMNNYYCGACGCPIVQKSFSLESNCPLGKWKR
jgi:hypothetical protein